MLRGVPFGSAAVAGHSCFGVAGSDGHAVGRGRCDAFEIASREDDVDSGGVLLDPGRLRGPGDRDGASLNQPRESELRRRDAFLVSDDLEGVDDAEVRIDRRVGEPGQVPPGVPCGEVVLAGDGAGEEPAAERLEGHKPDPEL